MVGLKWSKSVNTLNVKKLVSLLLFILNQKEDKTIYQNYKFPVLQGREFESRAGPKQSYSV